MPRDKHPHRSTSASINFTSQMRLLRVHELKVIEFKNDRKRPPYAILSHTWEQGEVSFQDIHTPAAKSMAGYTKILKCCEIAKQDGFDYVWIDTCCIDKTDSVELSKSIDSMFTWYLLASVCYAFLSDVIDKDNLNSQFRKSRWFKRGWTLQELIAPRNVVFYNRDWVKIGTKRSLWVPIVIATLIPLDVLWSIYNMEKYDLGQRMLMGALRDTENVDDIECDWLKGIFEFDRKKLPVRLRLMVFIEGLYNTDLQIVYFDFYRLIASLSLTSLLAYVCATLWDTYGCAR